MSATPSDAIVFFGATGDLAYKQIFPSLLGLIRDEGLNVPIIGVAKAGWNLDKLKARAVDSIAHHGGGDPQLVARLTGLLHYVDGEKRYILCPNGLEAGAQVVSGPESASIGPRSTELSMPRCRASTRSSRCSRWPIFSTRRPTITRASSSTRRRPGTRFACSPCPTRFAPWYRCST